MTGDMEVNNESALNFFKNLSEINKEEWAVKFNKTSDHTNYDVNFILKYISADMTILDLGSGTGLIINKLYNKVKHITAVEPVINFTKHIKKENNLEIINETVFEFVPKIKYDIITFFGVMQYFNEEEAIEIYKKYFIYVKEGGKILIKNQFGIHSDVIVDGYSEEMKTKYYSCYRYIEKEVNILKDIGFKKIETVDIYPPKCNRWENTHFYAIVAEK